MDPGLRRDDGFGWAIGALNCNVRLDVTAELRSARMGVIAVSGPAAFSRHSGEGRSPDKPKIKPALLLSPSKRASLAKKGRA